MQESSQVFDQELSAEEGLTEERCVKLKVYAGTTGHNRDFFCFLNKTVILIIIPLCNLYSKIFVKLFNYLWFEIFDLSINILDLMGEKPFSKAKSTYSK